jgi:hypothetical protein
MKVAPVSAITARPASSLAVMVKDCATPAVASVKEGPEAVLMEAQTSGRKPVAACTWWSGANAASNTKMAHLIVL